MYGRCEAYILISVPCARTPGGHEAPLIHQPALPQYSAALWYFNVREEQFADTAEEALELRQREISSLQGQDYLLSFNDRLQNPSGTVELIPSAKTIGLL